MDVLGFLSQHGFGFVNSALVVVLYKLIMDRVKDAEEKVSTLWDWHNQQIGIHSKQWRDDE